MKKTISGLMAIILTLSILFTLSSCKGKDEENTTAAATDTTTQAEVTDVDATTGAPDATGDTTAATETSLVDGTTAYNNTSTTQKNNAIPKGTAAIVAYYNATANKAKKDKPGYELTTTNYIGTITSSNGLIQSLAKSVVPMFSQDPTKSSAPKGSNGNFPIKGQSYGSKLEPSALKGATCVDKGSYYEIALNFKDEKLGDLPKDPSKTNHGKAMNVLNADEIYVQTNKFKSFVKIQQFAPTYTGSYIKCTVDKSTGNLKSATYYMSTIALVKAKPLIGSLDATVPFAIKEDYVLKY